VAAVLAACVGLCWSTRGFNSSSSSIVINCAEAAAGAAAAAVGSTGAWDHQQSSGAAAAAAAVPALAALGTAWLRPMQGFVLGLMVQEDPSTGQASRPPAASAWVGDAT